MDLWVTLPDDKGLVVEPLVLRSGRPEDLRIRRIDPKLGGFRGRRFRGLEDVGTNEDRGPREQRTNKR